MFDWDDEFIEYHQLGARNSKRDRSSGGISVLVRKTLEKKFNVFAANLNRAWCKVDKECYNLSQDLIICFVYIPPSDSNLFKGGLSINFDSLREECAECEKIGK